MMTLSLAGTTLLTGDVVATLLLDFAAALANAGRTATVELRAYTSDGLLTRALLLVDGRTPMTAIGSAVRMAEPDNSRVVGEISAALMAMLESTASEPTAGGIRPYFDDLDL